LPFVLFSGLFTTGTAAIALDLNQVLFYRFAAVIAAKFFLCCDRATAYFMRAITNICHDSFSF